MVAPRVRAIREVGGDLTKYQPVDSIK